MLLETPIGQELKLRDAYVEIELEGQSQAKTITEKKSRFEKFFNSDVDDGLLIVDLLSLKKRFSWARYKTDMIGFIVASVIVVFLIVLALIFARIGS